MLPFSWTVPVLGARRQPWQPSVPSAVASRASRLPWRCDVLERVSSQRLPVGRPHSVDCSQRNPKVMLDQLRSRRSPLWTESTAWVRYQSSGASILPKPMMHIAYFLYFHKSKKKFPYIHRIYKFPPICVQCLLPQFLPWRIYASCLTFRLPSYLLWRRLPRGGWLPPPPRLGGVRFKILYRVIQVLIQRCLLRRMVYLNIIYVIATQNYEFFTSAIFP